MLAVADRNELRENREVLRTKWLCKIIEVRNLSPLLLRKRVLRAARAHLAADRNLPLRPRSALWLLRGIHANLNNVAALVCKTFVEANAREQNVAVSWKINSDRTVTNCGRDGPRLWKSSLEVAA
jgi:hypothetical protein